MQESSTEKLPLTDEEIMDGAIRFFIGKVLNDSEPNEKDNKTITNYQ